jgi:hypothetical protein
MKVYKEKSAQYEGSLCISPSAIEKGKIVIETSMTQIASGKSAAAGIRLSREDARELATELMNLADHLFFEEIREKQAKEKESLELEKAKEILEKCIESLKG